MRAAPRQGSVLEVVRCETRPSSRVRARTPPVQYLFFAVVINVASTRFKADKGIMDALVPKEEKGGRGAGGGGKQLSESQSSRRRFGVCFTLTMPGSSRDHPSS